MDLAKMKVQSVCWGLMQVPELHSIGNVAAPPARYRHLTSSDDGVHVPDRPFPPNGGDMIRW